MQVFDLPEPLIRPDAIAFSPDGRRLAASERGRVFLIDTTMGSTRTLWPQDDEYPNRGIGIGFTPDGRGVIVHHSLLPDSVIEVHDVETGTTLRDVALGSRERCEVGPGGRLVYLAARRRGGAEFIRWNPCTGEMLPPFAQSKASSVQWLAVSGDEKWLVGADGEEVRLWNLAGEKLPTRATRQLRIDRALVVSLAISSDGAYLAAGSYLGMGGAVHVCRVRAGEWKEVCARERDTCRDLAFHPSRPVLAHRIGTGEVAFYDAASQTELKRYAWPVGEVMTVAFAPDGLRCAAAGVGKVVVWDADV